MRFILLIVYEIHPFPVIVESSIPSLSCLSQSCNPIYPLLFLNDRGVSSCGRVFLLLMTNHLLKTPVRLYPCKALLIHCLPIKNDMTLYCSDSLLHPYFLLHLIGCLFRRFYLYFSNSTLFTARLMLVLSISASKFLINKPSILLLTS
ncbi:unnamed protein product (mitochondrion) [Musa textilis]